MMQLIVEKRKAGFFEALFASDDDDIEPKIVELSEDSRCRITMESRNFDELPIANLNGVPLISVQFGNRFCFVSGDFRDPGTATFDTCISNLFNTLVGRQTLNVQCGDEETSIEFFVQPKYENWEHWIAPILSEFPLIRNPTLIGASSQMKAELRAAPTFLGRFDFIDNISTSLKKVSSSLLRSGYLHFRNVKVPADVGFSGRPDQAIRTLRKNRVDWRRVPLSSISVVRKGIKSFEPKGINKTRIEKDFDTPDNRRLYLVIDRCIAELRNQLDESKLARTNVPSYDPRGSRRVPGAIGLEALTKVDKAVEGLIEKAVSIRAELLKLGVKARDQNYHSRDPRFGELHEDIDSLEFWLRAIIDGFFVGNHWVSSPDFSELFEYYCFAQLLRSLKLMGFELIDLASSKPVPWFVRLSNTETEENITIFYDQEVPGADEKQFVHNGRPLVSTLRSRPAAGWYRPDFQVLISNNSHQATAILDAKYSRPQQIDRGKIVKILSEKYSYNFSSNRKFGKPAIYIGALCLPRENEISEFKTKMAESVTFGGPISASFITNGWSSVSSQQDAPLTELLEDLLAKFRDMAVQDELDKVVNWVRPEKYEAQPIQPSLRGKGRLVQFRQPTRRSSKHLAPPLDKEMAAKIKGMLARGDKDMDIQLFFGINSGRVSDVKAGRRFPEVEAAPPNELPPQGPYPTISELIGNGSISLQNYKE